MIRIIPRPSPADGDGSPEVPRPIDWLRWPTILYRNLKPEEPMPREKVLAEIHALLSEYDSNAVDTSSIDELLGNVIIRLNAEMRRARKAAL